LVFVAGMLAGMLIFSLFESGDERSPLNTDRLTGTMTDTGTPADWTSAGTLQLVDAAFKGTCQSRYNESLVEMYLTIASPNAIETSFEFSTDDFELETVITGQLAAGTNIATLDGNVLIRSSGDNQLSIRLRNLNNRAHNVLLKITQNGNRIYQGSIAINQ
jgi:hypothetical protein